MKLSHHQTRRTRQQSGSAVFIFIVLLSLMMIFIAVNNGTLFRLHGELRLIERRQLEHWNLKNAAPGTNNLAPAKTATP